MCHIRWQAARDVLYDMEVAICVAGKYWGASMWLYCSIAHTCTGFGQGRGAILGGR